MLTLHLRGQRGPDYYTFPDRKGAGYQRIKRRRGTDRGNIMVEKGLGPSRERGRLSLDGENMERRKQQDYSAEKKNAEPDSKRGKNVC